MRKRLSFSIAEISIEVVGREGVPDMFFETSLHNFSTVAKGDADIRIEVDAVGPREPFPALDGAKQLFTATPGGLWTVYDDPGRGRFIITLHDVANEPVPYKFVTVDRLFKRFQVSARLREGRGLIPLEYPLDELIVSGYVNINNIGILLHSAAILDRGEALLFAGVSGAGKSTLAAIWQQDGEADVVTDERVILRERQGAYWAFGTPWHGTAGIHQNRGGRVRAIYFIGHGRKNSARRLSVPDAAKHLMVRCFPTFWNRDGMTAALTSCVRIAEKVPCYGLEFVPDLSVTGYVRGHARSLPA